MIYTFITCILDEAKEMMLIFTSDTWLVALLFADRKANVVNTNDARPLKF